jgi:hypothetical protein
MNAIENDRDQIATEVTFILAESLKLDIRIGTNGDELLVVYPRTKLPRETYRYFSRAIFEHREAIMAHIIAENGPCQTT